MPDDSVIQMKLARDAGFLGRMQYLMVKVALDVKAEAESTPGHAQREALAAQVLGDPALIAPAMAVGAVCSINLTSETTTVNPDGSVVTSATDGEMFSQINALWNFYAGV
jgi:hypothetical protein